MKEIALPVVIAALIKDNRVLLIRRRRGDYVGLWGLLGGKVEKNEHLSEAAIREVLEESGIETNFRNYLGFVSELLIENNNICQHFLLHICELEPKDTRIKNGSEGKVDWFDLNNLQQIREEIIPSDFLIIEKVIKNREKPYYECILEKNGDSYLLKKFE